MEYSCMCEQKFEVQGNCPPSTITLNILRSISMSQCLEPNSFHPIVSFLWRVSNQQPILVTDESRFLLAKFDGREWVWRCPNKRMDCCISETDTAEAALSWFGVVSHGHCWTDLVVIQGNLKGMCYWDGILARHVVPFKAGHFRDISTW